MKLTDHHSAEFVKLMYIGDSSTGKTGSLASLVEAGYDLGVLDMDNGLDILRQLLKPKGLADKVDYETRRNSYKSTPQGPKVEGQPRAFTDALDLMTKWSDGSDPSEWGKDKIFVLDSFTSFGRSALEWARHMNPMAKDGRQWFFTAQNACEDTLALLTSAAFKTNVIVISHVNWKELHDGTHKGYPAAVGSALGPHIPKYFNTLVMAEKSGQGENVRRKIRTVPTATIDLKSPAIEGDAEFPLETGMASLFEQLKGLENG